MDATQNKQVIHDLFEKGMARLLEEAQVPQKLHLQVVEQLAKRIKQHEADNVKHLKLIDAYQKELERFKITKGEDGMDGKDADEQVIIRAVLSKIRQPKDGKSVDEEKIVRSVLSRLPVPKDGEAGKGAEIDMEALTGQVLAAIKSLKGQKDKSIGLQDIDGLEERLSQMQLTAQQRRSGFNFNGQFYRFEELMRGAGGSGGGLSLLTATGTIDDSNKVFTFASTPTIVVVNGANYRDGHGVSIVTTTATLDNVVGTGGDIFGLG